MVSRPFKYILIALKSSQQAKFFHHIMKALSHFLIILEIGGEL